MVSKNPPKIGKANDMFNLPIVPTQVMKTINVISVYLSRAAHLHKIGPRGRVMH